MFVPCEWTLSKGHLLLINASENNLCLAQSTRRQMAAFPFLALIRGCANHRVWCMWFISTLDCERTLCRELCKVSYTDSILLSHAKGEICHQIHEMTQDENKDSKSSPLHSHTHPASPLLSSPPQPSLPHFLHLCTVEIMSLNFILLCWWKNSHS